MARVYISYSTKDKDLVPELMNSLVGNGYEVLADNTVLRPGIEWREALEDALASSTVFIVIITQNSSTSENVIAEIGQARMRARSLKEKFLMFGIILGGIPIPGLLNESFCITSSENVISKEAIRQAINAVNEFQYEQEAKSESFELLKEGSSGSKIRELQEALNIIEGEEQFIDGVYGPITKGVVLNFQKNRGLKETGFVDKATWEAIIAAKDSTSAMAKNKKSEPSFWLLHCNPNEWEYIENTPAWFHTHWTSGEKRPEYQLFHQVKKGDIILAFSTWQQGLIEAVFEVIKGPNTDRQKGEQISLIVKRVLRQPISEAHALEVVGPDGQEKFSRTNQRLYPLTSVEFSSILNIAAEEDRKYIEASVALEVKLFSDQPSDEDLLGYNEYAAAISGIIADAKTKPPLAIAIMAPWGQGKSTLMGFIKKRIEKKRGEVDSNNTTKATFKKIKEWINSPNFTTEAKLQSPTVWFNPWQYQSSEQIWSGMAHAVITQLVQQLPLAAQEEFWFKLQLARFDTIALKKDIAKDVALKFIPWLVAAGLMFLVGLALIAKQIFWGGSVVSYNYCNCHYL